MVHVFKKKKRRRRKKKKRKTSHKCRMCDLAQFKHVQQTRSILCRYSLTLEVDNICLQHLQEGWIHTVLGFLHRDLPNYPQEKHFVLSPQHPLRLITDLWIGGTYIYMSYQKMTTKTIKRWDGRYSINIYCFSSCWEQSHTAVPEKTTVENNSSQKNI